MGENKGEKKKVHERGNEKHAMSYHLIANPHKHYKQEMVAGMNGWYLWGKMKWNGKYKAISVIRVVSCCYSYWLHYKQVTNTLHCTNTHHRKTCKKQVVYIQLVMIIIGAVRAIQATMWWHPKKELKSMYINHIVDFTFLVYADRWKTKW